ncbi:putative peptidoglycan glycosyltransferase FtsW [Methylocella sp. CPCC 101449]|jgi:cell division protein FtsW|uniref:FtsW/RodA/SpoVE family cell cycle protein n=1 Tax=Methylocella sp. CPCC 101449 TaxID=2987531 RepID=UPI0028928263|nr:putative peptidoglycan glycosyltransferase FtsW [Methylocella sp. CPCC 101449]MDT2023361.1 putative lipid II flippase FtsW [Methylocella sp. CPCC 101449]HEV2574105.1 putative peptidoglycan glycosyltransferase FtsW [Beijerinckiaceae bacterium]
MSSRAERTFVSDWWWTVDRWILSAIAILMVSGIVLTMAGSPAVAERLGLSTFHFVNRHLVYLVPTIALMVATSFLSPRMVRRAALVVFILGMVLIFAGLQFGAEIKGARRWIFGVQPSEFVKPAFVILAAWAFAEGAQRKEMPGTFLALLLLPATIVPLMLQPDFGQTMLISLVWAGLFFMAGLHWFWVAGIGGLGAGGVFFAYKTLPHVRLRIDKFLDPPPAASNGGPSATFQSDTAVESIINGGWFGRGPGEGTVKRILPDSHTDFIFAVTGEEFGIIFCIFLLSVFAFIVLRGLIVSSRNEDGFCRFATAGLVMLFGLQAIINMAVNLHVIPPKGMTLPFISYGGSSLLSLALTMGFLIAVTRRRPRSEIAERLS